jgi:hypothetical protein
MTPLALDALDALDSTASVIGSTVEHHSFEGAGPSRYMHIELLKEEIAQLCRFPRQS